MIKVIAFDAFGTLFNLDHSLVKNLNVEPILNYARQKQLEYTWLYSILDRYIPFNELTNNVLLDGIKKYDGNIEWLDSLSQLYFNPSCYQDVKSGLRDLRKSNCKLGILSNGTSTMLHSGIKKNNLEDLFDFVCSADTTKVFKPSMKVYQLIINLHKVEKEEVLFVSSNQWDIAGALKFGFSCAWLNRKREHAESIITTHKYYEISNLSEIKSLL